MKAAADSVKAGEPVWFGSEVNLLTVSMAAGLNKLDRLSVASFSSLVKYFRVRQAHLSDAPLL